MLLKVEVVVEVVVLVFCQHKEKALALLLGYEQAFAFQIWREIFALKISFTT